MTVQNTTVKDIYVGNGATTKFPITFQMTDHPEYIKVYITGDDSVAVETENFSVDLGAKTVTYPANGDPLPDGHKITIYRELPLYQLMNLVNQGPFFAENIELSFDDLTFICQQLNEKLNRTLSAGVDVNNFNNTFPVKAGMSFRINDAGDGLVLTEDPARVLPLAKDVLEQTKQVKESAVNETTNIKNTAIEELTAIKDAAVNETTEIKDEAVAAKNTAVEAAATAAEDAVNNVQTLLDEKVDAAENAKSVAVSSAESALASKNAAAASQSSAAASAETAQASAESASSSADAALASKNAALTSENNAKASETKSAKSEENAKAAETAAENSKKSASDSASAASSSAESALESKTLAAASANSASASKTSAESSAKSAASSATTATEQADRAQDIADSLEGLAGITGIATTDEAIAGVVDNKAMTPLKTKEAIESLVPMQRLIDLIYPVGSIYMSVNSTSPADLFGGTWEAMPAGRVLLAQGTSEWGVEYKAGSTGGEHEHKLSVGEIPQFTPTGTLSSAALTGYQNFWSVTWNDGGPLGGASGIISQSTYDGTPGWVGASTGSQKPGRSSINASHAHKLTFESIGGGSAHNIMQPYLSVFMWKRTA